MNSSAAPKIPTAAAFTELYGELKRIAVSHLERMGRNHTLSPTALVNEAYIRMFATGEFRDQSHFYRSAAQAMRHILVDYARKKMSRKRGKGARRLPLSEHLLKGLLDGDGLLHLHDALTHLESQDPLAAELVKLRVFCKRPMNHRLNGFFSQGLAQSDLSLVLISPGRLWANFPPGKPFPFPKV